MINCMCMSTTIFKHRKILKINELCNYRFDKKPLRMLGNPVLVSECFHITDIRLNKKIIMIDYGVTQKFITIRIELYE